MKVWQLKVLAISGGVLWTPHRTRYQIYPNLGRLEGFLRAPTTHCGVDPVTAGCALRAAGNCCQRVGEFVPRMFTVGLDVHPRGRM
eukprot:8754234-Alexandrium_andersonii.AAC.1